MFFVAVVVVIVVGSDLLSLLDCREITGRGKEKDEEKKKHVSCDHLISRKEKSEKAQIQQGGGIPRNPIAVSALGVLSWGPDSCWPARSSPPMTECDFCISDMHLFPQPS